MSEWIKFTFSTDDDFKSWIELKLDGVTGDGHMHLGGVDDVVEGTSRKGSRDIWVEIPDHQAAATDTHVVQIDITDSEGDDGSKPSSSITLDSIMLGSQVHTPASASINESVSKWNVITPEIQTLIDNGELADGTTETADLGYGTKTFHKTNWEGNRIIGRGSWQLTFSCPYVDWFNTVHQD